MLRSARPIVQNHDAAMSKNISIKDVVAVVDGTPASLTGVDQAIAYAGIHDATLTIVVVTENLAWASAVDPMAYADAMEASDTQRKEHVAAVRERVAGAPVHVEVHALFEALAFSPGLPRRRGSMQISPSSPELVAGRAMACAATLLRRSCSRVCRQW